MLSLVYIFSAHNNCLALSALHGDLEALHCSSDGPNMGPLGGPLLGKFEGHGDSGFIGNDKLRLCKAVPNLYVELRRSVLGVRVPGDIQMKGFGVKIGPILGMGVPDMVQSAGGYRGSTAP